MLIAIDTATDLAGIALFDGAVRAELIWRAGRRHSTQLLPQIERLLDLVDLDVAALTGVAAARGPGSFTGVRVGLAVAQGLAIGLSVSAFGICTLDVLAAGQEASPLPVRPLLDAGRGRFATALYERRDGRLRRRGEMEAVTVEQLPALVGGPCRLCGDLDEGARVQLRGMLGSEVEIASAATSLRRPGVLAQLGWEQLRAGEAGDPAALEPVYLTR